VGLSLQAPVFARIYNERMRSATAWAAAAACGLALAACDVPGSRDAVDARGRAPAFDPAAPRNRPEPVRFSEPGPPTPPLADKIARTAAALETAADAPAKTDDAESVASNAGRIFDGTRTRTAPTPVTAPRVGAAGADGAKRNSPVPDRVEDGALVLEDRQFAVDTDGLIADPVRRRRVVANDRDHRNGTALFVGGRPLDSTVVPYISIPMDFKGARLGDMAKACYGGRCAWAVIGDIGPAGRFGEGSVALAERLGLSGDGNSGGAAGGVTYRLFPGSRAPLAQGQTRLASYLGARGDAPSSRILLADAR
jgi:hypothetical protein